MTGQLNELLNNIGMQIERELADTKFPEKEDEV